MAISFVNKSTLTTGAARTTSTVTAPASIADGDILLFYLLCDTNGTVTLPTGFTNFTGSPYNNAGYLGAGLWIFAAWKRAASESGNYSATHTSRSTAGMMAAYRGCIASGTPTDATPTTNQGTSTTPTWTGVTTATDGTLLVAYGNGDTTAGTSSSTMTERNDFNAAPDSGMLYDIVQTSAGATGNKTATITSQNWMTFLVPLKIASSATTGTITSSVKKVTVSLTGAQAQTGTVATTLTKVSSSFTGVMQPKGSMASTLVKVSASMTGAQTQSGSVGATLLKVTCVMSGYMLPEGSIGATLAKVFFGGSGSGGPDDAGVGVGFTRRFAFRRKRPYGMYF